MSVLFLNGVSWATCRVGEGSVVKGFLFFCARASLWLEFTLLSLDVGVSLFGGGRFSLSIGEGSIGILECVWAA